MNGKSLSALKSENMHMVIGQNGFFSSEKSNRDRTGLWYMNTRHISSLSISYAGDSNALPFEKYVRSFGYIYRQYKGSERVDYIPRDKGAYVIKMRFHEASSVNVSLGVSHEKAWPSAESCDSYKVDSEPGRISLRSRLAETTIHFGCNGVSSAISNGSSVEISFCDSSEIEMQISCDGALASDDDLGRTLKFHNQVKDSAMLESPDFRYNKLFLWAKHDLVELYSCSPNGNGFFAGMPKFSWFFGRDGEWMSFAAVETGIGTYAEKHLDFLYQHSLDGRIPHEIPLGNSEENGNYRYTLDKTAVNTQFMSIDSSPLWVIARYQLFVWTGDEKFLEGIDRVMEFAASCDTDRDGLIENDFSRGLIGWPESWAESRDGTCIEVNAWWIEALRLHCKYSGKMSELYEKAVRNFNETFFHGDGSSFTVYDSIYRGERRRIKSPMLIVPAMYSSDERTRALLSEFMNKSNLTPWGIRSMSTDDPMYDGGYHTGMIWPLMTGWFTLALYRNSMASEASRMLETFVNLAFDSDDPGRINEVYSSDTLSPQGQFFQGWSSSLFLQCVVEGVFGIPQVPSEITVENLKPALPDNWGSATLNRLAYRKKLLTISVNGKTVVMRDD